MTQTKWPPANPGRFTPLVIGALSRASEVLDVEQAFTKRQLVAGAYNMRAGQRAGVVAADLDPRLTIALLVGGIRQALVGALTKAHRPDRHELTEKIWVFVAGALRLPPASAQQENRTAHIPPATERRKRGSVRG